MWNIAFSIFWTASICLSSLSAVLQSQVEYPLKYPSLKFQSQNTVIQWSPNDEVLHFLVFKLMWQYKNKWQLLNFKEWINFIRKHPSQNQIYYYYYLSKNQQLFPDAYKENSPTETIHLPNDLRILPQFPDTTERHQSNLNDAARSVTYPGL